MKSRQTLSFIGVLIALVFALGFSQTEFCKGNTRFHPPKPRPSFLPALVSDLPAPIPSEEIVKHSYYTLSYNNHYELANWVSYTLKASMIAGISKRKNDYRIDPMLHCGSAKPSDYLNTHYDKGHLLPAGDMSFSDEAISETFYMSNMCPQKPGFNRGIWKKLEDQVRGWAIQYSELHICAGPIIAKGDPKIGEDKVAVPSYYYKLILDYREPGIKAIAFIIPNESSDKPIEDYAVSIDSVEHFTGINFFTSLPDSIENRLESKLILSDWNFSLYEHKNSKKKENIESADIKQCKAITKKGNRCERSTTHQNGLCGQHGGN